MRLRARLLIVLSTALVSLGSWQEGFAQVNDAERAAARQLFKEGDDFERAGKYAEALERFQRAERAYSAPTNVLRIAKCQLALGQLVESAESYRTVLRMPLPAGSPQAFQVAAAEAKGELAQLEPRIPKLVVQVSPATAAGVQLQIDGQEVSPALIGEAIPLDPGTHRVRVVARGFSPYEQEPTLNERDTTTVAAILRPLTAAPPPLPLPPPPRATSTATSTATPTPTPISTPTPAPPPTYVAPVDQGTADRSLSRARGPSGSGLLLGAHLGIELGGGKLPVGAAAVDTNVLAGTGLAWGLEGGLRFARHIYVGLVVDHAEMQHGDLSSLNGVADASASTTLFGGSLGFVYDPDRTSFYGELAAGTRWLSLTEKASDGTQTTTNYNAGEFALGAGVWVPLGRSLRLVPKLTIGFGAFDPPAAPPSASSPSPGSQGHSFVMLGVAGFYNLDF